MKIIITAREIMDKGLWKDVCRMFGYNEWAVNEGLMSEDDEIILTNSQAIELGLLQSMDIEPEETN